MCVCMYIHTYIDIHTHMLSSMGWLACYNNSRIVILSLELWEGLHVTTIAELLESRDKKQGTKSPQAGVVKSNTGSSIPLLYQFLKQNWSITKKE